MSKKKLFAAAVFFFTAVALNLWVWFTPGLNADSTWLKLLLCLCVDGVAVLCVFNVETVLRVPLEILRDRSMFLALVKNDFQARFAGSYLGRLWAFVSPVVTILLYWFVFQFGLRAGNVSDHPFVLYLMAGLIPWFFFQEALNGATAALVEYNYLVKKVVFNVSFLPVLKVCSALVVHVFFIAVFFIVGMVYGYYPGLTHLQLFYYILCTSFLVVGLGYITSAISVFFRDMMQIVNILLTIGTWATPILWNLDATVNGWLQIVFKLNPIYYIVSGFRDALLDKVWFWEKPVWTLYFWCVSVVVYLVGVKLFNRLKVHFSDVL